MLITYIHHGQTGFIACVPVLIEQMEGEIIYSHTAFAFT